MAGAHVLIAPLATLAFAQGPETLTPPGPATLYSDWHGAQTLEGEHPELLTGLRVTVLPGSQAGRVRFVVAHSAEQTTPEPPPRAVDVGAWVQLPAEPGTYVFPAPHVFADYRSVTYGIEQETGGHAILSQTRCAPEQGEDADPCSIQSVDVYAPPLGAAFPDRRLVADTRRGGQLLLDPLTEPDADRDGAGDATEDRTNLRATATTRTLSGGRRAFDIAIENAGPRAADLPRVQAYLSRSPGLGRWSANCKVAPFYPEPGQSDDIQRCALKPLAVGETRTVRLVVPDIGAGDAYFSVRGEGPDLAGGDEDPDAEYHGKRPRLWFDVDAHPKFENSLQLRVGVHSARKGPVKVQLQRGNRTWLRRTVTFRRSGGRTVVLRLPRNFFRADGVATLTARSGTATARARFEPSY